MDYKKFLVFVVILIAALSIGMTAYYFLRDNEVIVIKNVEVYANLGDEPFEIEIERRDPKPQTIISFEVADTAIVKQESTGLFRVLKEGTTEIILVTNKQRIETQKCIVHVGGGSSDNPYFIDDEDDLSNIGKDGGMPINGSYKLIADVDLSNVQNFAPIASAGFGGTFDGNNHTISGLTLNGTYENAGLFARISDTGIVKNLKIANFNISGAIQNGGIVAGINNGTIQCVAVENSVLSSTKTLANLGGIVGQNTSISTKAKIDRTSSKVNISSSGIAYIAGIAAQNNNAKIVNSYYIGELVSATTSSLRAGLVAQNTGSGSTDFSAIQKCYAVATFGDNYSNAYGIVANNNYNGHINYLLGLYYDATIAPNAIANPNGQTTQTDLFSGKTTDELSTKDTYIYFVDSEGTHTWNFDIIWAFEENATYPTLLMQGNESEISPAVDPGLILTAQDLANILNDLNGNYKLGADIELGSNWAPIGTESAPFTGTLDGNGHKINGLRITSLTTNAGLFGYNKGTLKDIKIYGVNITSGTNAVGAVASINEGTIENAEVITKSGNGKIEITTSTGIKAGAIVGENKGTINGATTDINVTVSAGSSTVANYVGGIAGTNIGYIYNVNSSSYVNASNIKVALIGGVVGENDGYIDNAKFKGTILASETNDEVYAGGIAGYNLSSAKIVESGVKTTATAYNLGGLVGLNNYGVVERCYVLEGTTLKGNKVGGLISALQRGEVSDCYTLAKLAGSSDSAMKAGFAVYVQGSTDLQGNGECARISHSFSASTFDSVGANYTESYSNIHLSLAGTNSNKEAGYIEDSIYDSTLASNATKAYTSGTWWWGSSEDDGGRSTSDCKSFSTFTGRGFDSKIWGASLDNSYPILLGINLNYFNA